MQLEQLVTLFNKRFQQERNIAEYPLRLARGKVEGKVGELRLTSVLKPLRLADSPLIVQGWEAVLRAFVESGSPHAILDVFAGAEDSSVINLDRLCRTVHMLNYLPKAWDDGVLFLEVNPRHVLSVKKNHGAYFEEVLASCGLTPRQVAVSVPFSHLSNSYQLALAQGLNNYRSRGYRLAVKLDQTRVEQIQQAAVFVTRLLPDYVKLEPAFLHDAAGHALSEQQHAAACRLVAVARSAGGLAIQSGIETAGHLAEALSWNAHLLEGEYFEQTAAQRLRNAA